MKYLFTGIALALAVSTGGLSIASTVPPAPATVAQETTIPYKKEESSPGASAGKSFAVLIVLLGIACGGLYVAKRYFPQLPIKLQLPVKNESGRRLHIVETMRLNPRTSLYLVQFDDRTILLAQSGDNVTAVAQGDGNDEFGKGKHHV